MARDHLGPDPDRLIVARISGFAMSHARWRETADDETAAAVAELRDVADNRPDLLAEEAGILLGFYEGGPGEPRAKAAAQLLIAAGADESLIPQWTEEGRRRALAARKLHSATRAGIHHGARERLVTPPALPGFDALPLSGWLGF